MEQTDKEDRMSEVSIGLDAKNLLENPLLQATLLAMEKQAFDKWKSSAIDDVASRELAYSEWRAVKDFTQNLTNIIISGEMSTEQLEADRLEAENSPEEFDSPNERRAGIHFA